jgi:DNA-binding MarR family transcriptional regulator
VVQSAACSRFHAAEQRLARWLLETVDRAGKPSFSPTHELLALMLGMRRPWVTKVIRRLRDRGCIRFRRGELTVADRARLEESPCECYASVRQQLRIGVTTPRQQPRIQAADVDASVD